MARLVITGNVGSGKSTLAASISEIADIPFQKLDWIQFESEKKYGKPDEILARLDDWLQAEDWIIEGTARLNVLKPVLSAADTIIFLDHPLWVNGLWATRRRLANFFRAKGNNMRAIPFYKSMWIVHTRFQPLLRSMIEDQRTEGKTVHHVRSPKQLNQLLETLRRAGS